MRKKDIRVILLAAAAGALLCAPAALAAQPRTGSITMELADEDTDIDLRDIYFYCIKIASCTEGGFKLKEEYRDSGVDLNKINTGYELKEAAEKLSGYAHTDMAVEKSDDRRSVKFSGLDPGAYLILSPVRPEEEIIEPSIIFVPMPCENGKDMCYDVAAKLKHSHVEEEKTVWPPKTGADGGEVYYYLAAGAGAALFYGIICASRHKKKKVLDNHKPYGTIKK